MAVRVWKTNLGLEYITRKKEGNMIKVRAVVRSDRLLTVKMIGSEWIWITEPSTTFWPRYWACRKFVQIWFQNNSPTNEKKTEGMFAWTLLNASKMTKTFSNMSEQVDFRVRSRHQTTKFGVAHEQLTAPEDSKNEQIENHIRANLFFDSQGAVHKEFAPQGQTVNQQYYHQLLERLRKRVHHVRPETAGTWMLHHGHAPCHTSISVKEFLTKKCIPVVPRPHTHLIWVRVTSSFPRNSNSTSEVVILELWTTSRRTCRIRWGHLHMKTSSTATASVSNVSGNVWLPKGTTLKGIMLICSSVVNGTSLFSF